MYEKRFTRSATSKSIKNQEEAGTKNNNDQQSEELSDLNAFLENRIDEFQNERSTPLSSAFVPGGSHSQSQTVLASTANKQNLLTPRQETYHERQEQYNKSQKDMYNLIEQASSGISARKKFETRGINTTTQSQQQQLQQHSQSVQALHQQISNLDKLDLRTVSSQASIVHDQAPLKEETYDMISMYAQQPSSRWKIAGKKPKTRSDEIEKTWAQLDKFAEKTSFTRTTAEGLYKREQDAGSFLKVEPAAKIQTRVKHQMKYDFTPNAVANMRAEQAKNAMSYKDETTIDPFDRDERARLWKKRLNEHEPSKFSSTIPSNWSSSGLYRRNELGKAQPLSTSTEANELGQYLKFERGGKQGQQLGASATQANLDYNVYNNNYMSGRNFRDNFQFQKSQENVLRQQLAGATGNKTNKGSSGLQGSVSKNTDPNLQEVHFFESPSKFIPLKGFNQLYANSYSHQMPVTVQSRSKDQKIQMVKKWFSTLSLQEQSVAVTTIDKDLVQLFKAMYKVYQNDGCNRGDFTAKLDRCDSVPQANSYKKVGSYQLLYQRSNTRSLQSKYISKQNTAANLIIENTRIVSIKEHNDALTLDVGFISCYSFFNEMMKLIDQEFLQRDYKMVKATASQIQGSLLMGQTHQAQHLQQNSPEINPLINNNSQRHSKEKPYFIMRDEHKPVYGAGSTPITSQLKLAEQSNPDLDFDIRSDDGNNSLHMPGYQTMTAYDNSMGQQRGGGAGGAKDENHISFAKCLLLMFEKAINVQFQDYLDKMQQTAVQNFFFIGKNELQDNVFSEDLKIADFWQRTDKKRKEELMYEPLNQMLKDLLKDYHENHKQCDNIEEQAECEEDQDDVQSTSNKSDLDRMDYENAMDYLKTPFRKDKNSDIEMTPYSIETTEYNGQTLTTTTREMPQFNQSVLRKNRRSRKDRAHGGAKSGTGTTSSSGINAGGTTISSSVYDYNPNQLTAQYGNNTCGNQPAQPSSGGYAEDLELGMGGANNFSINNYQLSDQEDNPSDQFDPEALLPLTHFSNNKGGLERHQQSQQLQEETKDPLPKKNKRRQLQINLQVPESYSKQDQNGTANHIGNQNELFKTPESILFVHKQQIVSGLNTNDNFLECLKFIKGLSASKNFEYVLKEQQNSAKNSTTMMNASQPSPRHQSQKKSKKNKHQPNQTTESSQQEQHKQSGKNSFLSNWELTNLTTAGKMRLMCMFLKHLEQKCQESILDDLLFDGTPSAQTNSSKDQQNNNNSNSNNHNATSSQNNNNSQSQQNTGTSSALQSNGNAAGGDPSQQSTASKKNRKKQKRKKNKKNAAANANNQEVITTTVAAAQQTDASAEGKMKAVGTTGSSTDVTVATKSQEEKIASLPVEEIGSVVKGPVEIELMPISNSAVASGKKKKKEKLSDAEDGSDLGMAEARDPRSHQEDEMIEEAKLQQVLRYHQELAKVDKQDQQLQEIQNQYEKLATVEQMLDDNIDPSMAIEMTGLKFTEEAGQRMSKNTIVDPQYLEMLQDRSNEVDEELGLGSTNSPTLTSKEPQSQIVLNNYERWLRKQFHGQKEVQSSDFLRNSSKYVKDRLFQDLLQEKKFSQLKSSTKPLNNDKVDISSVDLEEEAQESLSMMAPVGFRKPPIEEAKQWQRFQEERRGLLSDEIHLDKYPQETMMELSGAMTTEKEEDEDQAAQKNQEQKEMIAQVIAWQSYQELSTKTPSKVQADSGNGKNSSKSLSYRQARQQSPVMQYQKKRQAAIVESEEQEDHKDKERKEIAKKYYDSLMQSSNQDSPGVSANQLSKVLGQSHRPNPEDRQDPRKVIPIQISQKIKLSECTEEEIDQHLQARFGDPTVQMAVQSSRSKTLLKQTNQEEILKELLKTEDHKEQSGGQSGTKATDVANETINQAVADSPQNDGKSYQKKKQQKKNRRNKRRKQQQVDQKPAVSSFQSEQPALQEERKTSMVQTSQDQGSTKESQNNVSTLRKESQSAQKINQQAANSDQQLVDDYIINQDDVEEIPFDDNEYYAKPERDFQPPRVNTFFEDSLKNQAHGASSNVTPEMSQQTASASTTTKQTPTSNNTAAVDKKQRKEQRRIKKALQAMNESKVKNTSENTEQVADEVVLIESDVDCVSENEERERFVMDWTKNLISNTVSSVNYEEHQTPAASANTAAQATPISVVNNRQQVAVDAGSSQVTETTSAPAGTNTAPQQSQQPQPAKKANKKKNRKQIKKAMQLQQQEQKEREEKLKKEQQKATADKKASTKDEPQPKVSDKKQETNTKAAEEQQHPKTKEETKQSKGHNHANKSSSLVVHKKNEKPNASHVTSSKSSTTQNSLANLDSSVPYTWPPFVTNVNRTERSTHHRFRVDRSDNISIPERGTSSGSYGKREQEHSQVLQELDSLFPAKNKGSSMSAGSFKIRSSTLSKTRQPAKFAGHVGAFTTSAKQYYREDSSDVDEGNSILLKNAVKETDIQSQQQNKTSKDMRIRTFIEEHEDDYNKNSLMSPMKALENETSDTKLKTGGQSAITASTKKATTTVQATQASTAGKNTTTDLQQKSTAAQAVVTPGKPAPKISKSQARKQKTAQKKKLEAQQLQQQAAEEKEQKAAQLEQLKDLVSATEQIAKTVGAGKTAHQATTNTTQSLSGQQSSKQQQATSSASLPVAHQPATINKTGTNTTKQQKEASGSVTQTKAALKAQQAQASNAAKEPSQSLQQSKTNGGKQPVSTKNQTASSQMTNSAQVFSSALQGGNKQQTQQQQLLQASSQQQNSNNNGGNNQSLSQRANSKQQKIVSAQGVSHENQSQHAVKTQTQEKQTANKQGGQKKQKGGAGVAIPASPMLANNFSSYDNMFQAVFGAKAVGTKAVVASTNASGVPEEKKQVASKPSTATTAQLNNIESTTVETKQKETVIEKKTKNHAGVGAGATAGAKTTGVSVAATVNQASHQKKQDAADSLQSAPASSATGVSTSAGKDKQSATTTFNSTATTAALQPTFAQQANSVGNPHGGNNKSSQQHLKPIARSHASISEVFGSLGQQAAVTEENSQRSSFNPMKGVANNASNNPVVGGKVTNTSSVNDAKIGTSLYQEKHHSKNQQTSSSTASQQQDSSIQNKTTTNTVETTTSTSSQVATSKQATDFQPPQSVVANSGISGRPSGGIGVMMTPNRMAQTYNIPATGAEQQQQFQQYSSSASQHKQQWNQQHQQHAAAHQQNYQHSSTSRFSSHNNNFQHHQQPNGNQQQQQNLQNHQNYQQHNNQQQFLQQSFFQTPPLNNSNVASNNNVMMPQQPNGIQSQQNQQTSTTTTKQQMVSSYFQTTKSSSQTIEHQQQKDKAVSGSTMAQTASQKPLQDKRASRGVQFPFSNSSSQATNNNLGNSTQSSQSSSAVQMTVNLNIVQTTNQYGFVPPSAALQNAQNSPQSAQIPPAQASTTTTISNQSQQPLQRSPQQQSDGNILASSTTSPAQPQQIMMNLPNDYFNQYMSGLFQNTSPAPGAQQTQPFGASAVQHHGNFQPQPQQQQQPQQTPQFMFQHPQQQTQQMINPQSARGAPANFFQPVPSSMQMSTNQQQYGNPSPFTATGTTSTSNNVVLAGGSQRQPLLHQSVTNNNQNSAAKTDGNKNINKGVVGGNIDSESKQGQLQQQKVVKVASQQQEQQHKSTTQEHSQSSPSKPNKMQQVAEASQPSPANQQLPQSLIPTTNTSNSLMMNTSPGLFQLHQPQQQAPQQSILQPLHHQLTSAAPFNAQPFGGSQGSGSTQMTNFNNTSKHQQSVANHFYNGASNSNNNQQLNSQMAQQQQFHTHHHQHQHHHHHHPQHFPSYNQTASPAAQQLTQQQQSPLVLQTPYQMMNPHLPQFYQPQIQQMPVCIFEPVTLYQALTTHGVFSDKSIQASNSMSEAACGMNEDRFFELIGSQILTMQQMIEKRLAKVEPLRQDCFDKLFSLARQTYVEVPQERIEFKVYGSMATKLAIDTSDMDISIHGVVDSPSALVDTHSLRTLTVAAMERIHGRLDALEWIDSNMLIDKASVPVIKLVINMPKLEKLRDEKDRVFSEEEKSEQELCHYKQLKIDLIFNDILRARQVQDPFTGETYMEEGDSQSTQKCADFVKVQISKHPFLKPLAIILKKYLALKSLNSAFQGTLSSYGLVLMLLALLKDLSLQDPNLEAYPTGSHNFKVNLGKTFAHFLMVYGEQYSTQHFSIDERNDFVENQNNMATHLGLFSTPTSSVLQVADPINSTNNVGKQTYNFNLVQDQLHVTRQCLLVRFREHYEKVSAGQDLLFKQELLKRAIEVKTKREQTEKTNRKKINNSSAENSSSTSPRNVSNQLAMTSANVIADTKIAQLPTNEIFNYLYQELQFEQHVSPQSSQLLQLPTATGIVPNVPTQKDLQVERLVNRSHEQLEGDMEEIKELLAENKREIDGISDNLLNMIVMIKREDLTALQNDEIEEKQKIMQQFSREDKNWLRPLERLKINMDQQASLMQNQPHNSGGNNLFYHNNPPQHQYSSKMGHQPSNQHHMMKQSVLPFNPNPHHQQPQQQLSAQQQQQQAAQTFFQGFQRQIFEQFAAAGNPHNNNNHNSSYHQPPQNYNSNSNNSSYHGHHHQNHHNHHQHYNQQHYGGGGGHHNHHNNNQWHHNNNSNSGTGPSMNSGAGNSYPQQTLQYQVKTPRNNTNGAATVQQPNSNLMNTATHVNESSGANNNVNMVKDGVANDSEECKQL